MRVIIRLLIIFCLATISTCMLHSPKERDMIKRELRALLGNQKYKLSGGNDDPTPIMIEKAGYPAETHMVETDDGYVLQMHRIPHNRNETSLAPGETKPVVFLQHGLMGASDNWVTSFDYPQKSLAFILSDAGYDVWMGNYRGNTYSREHIHLDPEELPFWLFSWDEMGQYDLPAMMNKIMDTTKQEQMFYVGHSMGTTALMAMTDFHPELNDNIILASLLAPVAYVEHMKSPIALIAPIANILEDILEFFGIGEFFPSSALMDILADLVCDEDFLPQLCEDVMFLLMGFDKAQCNETLLDTIVHHNPAGSSSRTIVHYAQEVNTAEFCKYDFGRQGNIDHYGQPTPPNYDISKITIPIAAYYGDNDWLAQPSDVLRLTSQLPNLITSYRVPFDKWNHLDFLWAIDADTLLYPEVLKHMEAMRKQVPIWNRS